MIRVLLIVLAMTGMAAGAWFAYEKRNLLVQAALYSEGFSLSEDIKRGVSSHFILNGVMPHDNESADLPPAKSIFGTVVKRVAVNRSGVILVDFAAEIGEQTMTFTPSVNKSTGLIDWRCTSDSIDEKILSLLERKCEPTPATNEGQLLNAIANRSESEVARLLEIGTNPDSVVNGNTPLMLASKLGDLQIAAKLVDAGASIDNDSLNSERRTPLMVAISSNNADMASYLLSQGASVTRRDYKGLTAQDHAINTDRRLGSERYQLMVMAGLNPHFAGLQKHSEPTRSTADQSLHLQTLYIELTQAAHDCHVQRLETLLQGEGDLDQPEMVDGAVLSTHIAKPHCVVALSRFIKTKESYQSAMLERFSAAATACDVAEAESILERNSGIDILGVNAVGVSHLDSAIRGGCAAVITQFARDTELASRLPNSVLLDVVKNAPDEAQVELVGSLIAAGADVNGVDDGQTALGAAISLEQPVVAKYLIDAGADVNANTNSNSFPLIEASKKGYDYLVNRLIRKGADINKRDELGRTALHAAVARERHRLVDTLLRVGANPRIFDNDGISPVVLAETKNLRKIHTLLTASASN